MSKTYHMSLLPFTNAGVQDKQDELYLLSDADLMDEAKAMVDDLSSWLASNFELTVKQTAYLDATPAIVLTNWGSIIAAAVTARRPINMATPPIYGPPRRTKQITLEPLGSLVYFPPISGIGTVGGDLELNISFLLVD